MCLVFTSLFPEQMQYINSRGWKEDKLPHKVPLPETMIVLYSARKETPKKTLLAGSEKGKSTQCGEMPFLELELGFYSSCCELFSNPRAGSVIPYLFLFSYTTSTRPPKAQSRRLQVGKLKTSRSF